MFLYQVTSQAFFPDHQCHTNTKSFMSIFELKAFINIFCNAEKQIQLKNRSK